MPVPDGQVPVDPAPAKDSVLDSQSGDCESLEPAIDNTAMQRTSAPSVCQCAHREMTSHDPMPLGIHPGKAMRWLERRFVSRTCPVKKFRTVAERRSVSRLRTPDAVLVNVM